MGENSTNSKRGIASINPATGQVLQHFEPHSPEEVERRLELAGQTFRSYRRTPFAQRAHFLDRVAEILETEKTDLARTITLEMGKPIKAAIKEVQKCATACRYYAENGARFLAQEPPGQEAKRYVRCEPLGPVLAVMPWNFPFWQVFRFAAPALMAGNVGLLKHASNVPGCAQKIESVLHRGGFPQGAFQILLIGSEQVTGVIEDPRVAAVTLTGSVGAGSSVASTAARQIKKTVLELGGSDPFIVMRSGDLERAVQTAVRARTINNGQSCIAAKRFIIDKAIAAEFEERFIKEMAALRVGDPLDGETELGPLATEQSAAELQKQVDKTISMGARLLLGGKRLNGPGYFFPPTVLTNIPAGSPAVEGELFGPVASLFHAGSAAEAIEIANSTRFGLGASAWTTEATEQKAFIENLEAGLVFINGMVASDPALPFGGIKQSGYGRELSHQGIREFINVKTVVVQ